MQELKDDASVRSSIEEKVSGSTMKPVMSSRLHKFMRKKRLKLGIKPQLIIIVAFSSIFSLLVLAIITGVYFNNQLTNMQATKLEVMAQLKVTQVEQSMQLLYNQVYWVSIRPPIVDALTSLRAGNTSASVFLEAEGALNLSIGTTELLTEARLYDLDLNVVVSTRNNYTNLQASVADQLYPLRQNKSIPSSLLSVTVTPYYTGPLSNDTALEFDDSKNSSYYMGFTFPVFSNASIVYDTPTLAGFLSMIVNVTSVQKAVVSSDVTDESHSVFYMASPLWSAPNSEDFTPYKTLLDQLLEEWKYVFFTSDSHVTGAAFGDLPDDDWLLEALGTPSTRNLASVLNKSSGNAVGVSGGSPNNFNRPVAAGYSYVSDLDNLNWHVIVEQPWSVFSGPVNKLKGIIAGVVVGTCIIACSITFGLAVLFVRPITRLQEATEGIAKFKKSPEYVEIKDGTTPIPRSRSTDPRDLNDDNNLHEYSPDHKITDRTARNSVASAGSYGSGAFSTGLRLPGRIPPVSSFFKDELTELTDAFNIMTEELDQQYQYLEERVKMRTKELEASKIEAESANEAKTVFIANISHELRTPLNGILGMTAIAMEEGDQDRIQDSLRLIYRSGELLLHILTELLTYSKNTLNRSKLEPTNFQILEVVYQVKSIFDKLAQDQGVNFKIIIKPNALRRLILHGDSNRIIQIVMNLVSNALKFTPVEGFVNVNFKLLGEYDEARSKEADLQKVFVKNAPPGPPAPNMKDSASQVEVLRAFLISNRDPPTIAVTSGDSDNISVTTLSTNGYENHLFDAQFDTKNAQIMHSPDVADQTSVCTQSKDTGKSAYSAILPKISESLTVNDSGSPSSSLLESPIETQNPDQRKKFKLRKTYVPKTWVIRIEVSDTGPGIDASLQEKVFEPFIQGDQTLSRSYGGTGLGLSICRQLAAMMNGTLLLESKVGVGSTFVFTVPLQQTAELVVNDSDFHSFCEDEFNPNSRTNRKVAFRNTPLASPMIVTEDLNDDSPTGSGDDYFAMCRSHPKNTIPKSPKFERNRDDFTTQTTNSSFEINPVKLQLAKQTRAENGGAAKGQDLGHEDPSAEIRPLDSQKILVAEDNKVNQEVIKRMLRLEHWNNVTFACNGEEAFELFSKSVDHNERFDIVFMDVQMPKLDGLACTKLIRQIDNQVPIIALTAFADESNVKECLSSGMSGFLSKPIKRKSLRKIVAQLCPSLMVGKELESG